MKRYSMQRFLVFMLALVIIASCNKDKLQTKPYIKIKSEGPSQVSNGGIFSLEFEYGDKEGDISNTLFVQKIRTNSRKVPTLRDTFSLRMPDIPKFPQGNLEVTLYYQNHLISAVNPPNLGGSPPVYENDSLIIRFVLRDKAGNTSDTVSTKPIVVSRNN